MPTGKFGTVTRNRFLVVHLSVLYGTDIVLTGFVGVAPMQQADLQGRRQPTRPHVHMGAMRKSGCPAPSRIGRV